MRWLDRRREQRRNRRDLAVLGALHKANYAGDIWRLLGGNVGQIYVSLARMEAAGVVQSTIAGDDTHRRRRYWIAGPW